MSIIIIVFIFWPTGTKPVGTKALENETTDCNKLAGSERVLK